MQGEGGGGGATPPKASIGIRCSRRACVYVHTWTRAMAESSCWLSTSRILSDSTCGLGGASMRKTASSGCDVDEKANVYERRGRECSCGRGGEGGGEARGHQRRRKGV